MLDSDTETVLRTLEEQRRQAMLASDVTALRELLSESLDYVHSNGACDGRESFLAKLERSEIQYQRLALELQTVHAGRHFALLAGTMDADILVSGKPLHVRSLYEAVWTHAPNGWVASVIRSFVLPPT